MRSKKLLAALFFVCAITANAQEPDMFTVACPKCGTEFCRSALTISTNRAEPVLNGTNYHLTITMQCPNGACRNKFEAKSERLVPDTFATLVLRDAPRSLRAAQSTIPVNITNSEPGVFVLSTSSNYRLKLEPMSAYTVGALMETYNTNRARMWVVFVEREPIPPPSLPTSLPTTNQNKGIK